MQYNDWLHKYGVLDTKKFDTGATVDAREVDLRLQVPAHGGKSQEEIFLPARRYAIAGIIT